MQKAPQNYTLLPQGEASPLPPRPKRWNRRVWQWIVPALLATTVILGLIITNIKGDGDAQSLPPSGHSACPQYPPLKALSSERERFEDEVKDEIDSEAFFKKSVKRMQGAVQIATESFDDMGKVGNDSRWDIFKDFHAYLAEAFPLV